MFKCLIFYIILYSIILYYIRKIFCCINISCWEPYIFSFFTKITFLWTRYDWYMLHTTCALYSQSTDNNLVWKPRIWYWNNTIVCVQKAIKHLEVTNIFTCKLKLAKDDLQQLWEISCLILTVLQGIFFEAQVHVRAKSTIYPPSLL